MRDPQGVINFKTVRTTPNHPLLRLPLIRGCGRAVSGAGDRDQGNRIIPVILLFRKRGEKPLSPWSIALSIGMALALAIALFKFLPLGVATLLGVAL